MEYIEIDKTTSQIISAGSSTPMFGGLVVEVPNLPQKADPTMNICDYYWDGGNFVHRPQSNWHKITMRNRELDTAITKALVRFMVEELNALRASVGLPALLLRDVRDKLKSYIT